MTIAGEKNASSDANISTIVSAAQPGEGQLPNADQRARRVMQTIAAQSARPIVPAEQAQKARREGHAVPVGRTSVPETRRWLGGVPERRKSHSKSAGFSSDHNNAKCTVADKAEHQASWRLSDSFRSRFAAHRQPDQRTSRNRPPPAGATKPKADRLRIGNIAAMRAFFQSARPLAPGPSCFTRCQQGYRSQQYPKAGGDWWRVRATKRGLSGP